MVLSGDDDHFEDQRRRLRRARWRARSAAPGGPEWDAASAEIEELEREIYGPTRAPDPNDGEAPADA
jgi:hypothetical protein